MKIPSSVYSAVSGEEPSGWLPNEAELIAQNQEAFDEAMREVAEDILKLLAEKAKEYDFGETWWSHQPFGDFSFVSAIAEIVRRLESVLRGSHLNKLSIVEDKSQDLLAYTLAWLAWRRIKLAQLVAKRQAVRSDTEKALDDFATSVANEAFQRVDREIMDEQERYDQGASLPPSPIPPRPEPTTGPVPKEGLVRRLRKLGRRE